MALSIRRRRPAPITPTPSRDGLRASAQRFVLKGRSLGQKQGAPKRAWQDEAWDYFDDVAELKHTIWLMGNVIGKLRLFPAVRNPEDPEAPLIPVTDPQSGISPDVAAKAVAELERLRSELGGQTEIIRALNMNLEVAGEGYIIGLGPREIEVKDDVGTVVRVDLLPESWGVYSISQVTEKGDKYTVTKLAGESKGIDINEDLDTIIRVWQRHPRWSLEADCNLRGVLSDCEALTLLQNSIKAEAKSRMSGGYLLLPNTLRKGPSRPEPDEGEEAVVDEFTQLLYDGATEAVEDPSAASAVAPTFIFGDKEDLAQVRHLSIARASDATVLQKISALIERIARGANAPVELTMGHQQTTFANAYQVKQDTFDEYLEPRCDLIADVLTVAYLQPNLVDLAVPEEIAQQILVGYDPSRMILQVNPVDSADDGLDKGAISKAAWRRVKGWSEDDAPGEGDAAPMVGDEPPVDEPVPVPEPIAASKNLILAAARSDGMLLPIAAARSNRNLGFDLMLLDRELRARLLVAANAALNRALELAGNRLRSKAGKIRSLAKAGKINPIYVGATLGPSLVAAAGIADDDLISDAAWAALGANFDQWVAAAQERALTLTSRVVPVSDAQREIVEQRQAVDRAQAWEWMRDELHKLAHERLYAPDPAVPDVGEFDPTSRVPAGLVRQALARAGGATGLTTPTKVKPALRAADRSGDVFVAVNNNEPAGGIGLGETIKTVLNESGGGIEGYEWVYGPAYRQSPFEPHEELDGEQFENFDDDVLVAGDWIGDYYFPGDHDGCVVPGTVVSGARPSSLSLRWHEGPVVKLTTAAGQQLTVTPNHPVLTDRGWVRAQALVEGDHVVRCVDGERAADLIPHEYQAPAAVEDLFAARWVSPDVVAAGVPVAAEDFHGDGFAGEVCVVLTDRDLMTDGHPEVVEPSGEDDLGRTRRVAADLAGAGRAFEGLDRVSPATASVVRSSGHRTTSLGCAAGSDDERLLALGSWADADTSEAKDDGLALHAVSLGESLDGLAGAVELDKLIEVDRSGSFAGHVFNLHNDVQWYVAGGIVIHNCNCDIAPTIIAAGEAQAEDEPHLAQTFYEGVVGQRDHITLREEGTISPDVIANLPGVQGEMPGEHRNKQGEEWEAFVADIRENGVREPIFVTVDYNGEPRISEGNHRRDAAIEAGLKDVLIEIRYFGHAEQQGTLLERAAKFVLDEADEITRPRPKKR